MLKQQIAARLEQEFSQHGFAQPSVAQLKTACNVSLRTLYKYYPSKESMIVAALTYRHQRYVDFLLQDNPEFGIESVLHIFNRLEQWMADYSPNGCLSINAIAAFPDNRLINQAVKEHKRQVCLLIGEQSQRQDLATPLFILHEGVSNAWPVVGEDAGYGARVVIKQLFSNAQ